MDLKRVEQEKKKKVIKLMKWARDSTPTDDEIELEYFRAKERMEETIGKELEGLKSSLEGLFKEEK